MITSTTSQATAKMPQKFSLVSLLQKWYALNPVLTLVGLANIMLLIAALIGIFVDPRIITGVPAWVKPAKFAISSAIYSFSLLWLMSFVQGFKRTIGVTSTIIGLILAAEVTIIVGQVIRGTTSHFNISTALDGMLWGIMGSMIMVLFVLHMIVTVCVLIQRIPDPTFAWSLRLGLLIMAVGLGVAFLMTTSPTPEQMAAVHAGAPLTSVGGHTVGLADGGPGIPFLGWSTVGGDLRIPHFVGMHAFQVMPFLGWLLAILPVSWLRRGHRVALVWTLAASYLGLVGLLTWQALRAQSLIAPDALTLQALAALLSATALAVFFIIIHARTTVKQP
jgi:hypothetical protein